MSIELHPRSTLFISGFLLLMHICNMAQSIEAGFPYFSKVELGYAVVWGIVFIVASIIATITFKFAVVSMNTSHLNYYRVSHLLRERKMLTPKLKLRYAISLSI